MLSSIIPKVSRATLLKAAGVFWAIGGIVLLVRAAVLAGGLSRREYWAIALPAVAVGLLKARFVFFKVVQRNSERIRALAPAREKICVFAFQSFQAYLVVLLMIALGVGLRLSPVPRRYLDPSLEALYVAVGSALLFSSVRYFQFRVET